MTSPAKKILDAARAIVVERGMTALTVQAVATRAGVHKSAIGYHFGNKEGLMLALEASLFAEGPELPHALVAKVPDPAQRFSAYMAMHRRLTVQQDYWRLAFALWPLDYRDEKLRARIAVGFDRHLASDLETLRMQQDDPDNWALMSVLYAALEGLALQYQVRGPEMDLDACFERLESALAAAFLRSMETVPSA
jgi:AcrR family transcriptional regulator